MTLKNKVLTSILSAIKKGAIMAKLTYKQRIKRITESTIRYQKKAMRAYSFRFHKVNDAKIITQLDAVDNRSDYLRQLILKDISDK